MGWLCAWSGFCCLRVGTGSFHHWPSSLHWSQIGAVLPKCTPKSAPEHLNCVLGYFSSYLWPHRGDLLVRTLRWPLLIGYVCVVSIVKMLSRFDLGEKVDTRHWREVCNSRWRALVFYLAVSSLIGSSPRLGCSSLLSSFDQVFRCLTGDDHRAFRWTVRLSPQPTARRLCFAVAVQWPPAVVVFPLSLDWFPPAFLIKVHHRRRPPWAFPPLKRQVCSFVTWKPGKRT